MISKDIAQQFQLTQIKKSKNGKVIDDGTKNLRGKLGPICEYCAGLGYTASLQGNSLRCTRCEGTGIEPLSNKDINQRLNNVEKELQDLKQIIIKYAKQK